MDDSSEGSKELVRLWRAWRTAREMCKDRGYELLDEEIQISLEQFREQYADGSGYPDRKKMAFSARPTEDMIEKYKDPKAPDSPSAIGTIWVEFNGDANVGIKQLRQFCQHVDQNQFYTGVFISAVPVTPSALKIIPTVLPRIIETFLEQDLLVNITRHELVPKHVLLSKEEKAKLLERYRLKESQLPRIQVTDPMAKYLGLRRGQVVKIIRRSVTAGRYASYRWCI
ncbi:RPB5 subunit of DNA-directed RNA polymerase [Patellaria atrata CBS 101060]|uniref:DNA-directed RNA polymerases I, II, and III subunit RPABC1 n=1 Tax=Patellaria atrata CBS 101060 TaxID=1346257 RepID=A0A9P4S280_9PEZI|nr:RPB5 subunit of DNA-directed RNA polymerase [Patellaria atrata CBS 101060]